MSDEPTSAPDFAAARAAGWSSGDLEWEAKAEQAAQLDRDGAAEQAAALWHQALTLAQSDFAENDPRLGTSLANVALAERRAGRAPAAAQHFAAARRIWDASAFWVDSLAPERRARSSLFHLRMEARHRETYDANFRRRLHRFAEEARENLRALEQDEPPPHRGVERWRAEKPGHYGESRKLLAACLLLAVPGSAPAR